MKKYEVTIYGADSGEYGGTLTISIESKSLKEAKSQASKLADNFIKHMSPDHTAVWHISRRLVDSY